MIKILACIFMLIDHVGLFFPEVVLLRLIGRMSMPLFAYCIARGMRNTQDIKRYLLRVILIAIISQVPYMLVIKQGLQLNICFLWAMSIAFICLFNAHKGLLVRAFILVAAIVCLETIPVEYGAYGMLYVLILFYYHENDNKLYLAWSGLHILKMIIDLSTGIIQLFTLPTIPIIDMCNRYGLEQKYHTRLNKILLWFYPVHLMALFLLSIMI